MLGIMAKPPGPRAVSCTHGIPVVTSYDDQLLFRGVVVGGSTHLGAGFMTAVERPVFRSPFSKKN